MRYLQNISLSKIIWCNHTTSPKLLRLITQEHTYTTHKALVDFNAYELTQNHIIQLKSLLNTQISGTGITVGVAVEDNRVVVASAIAPHEAGFGIQGRRERAARGGINVGVKVAVSRWLS